MAPKMSSVKKMQSYNLVRDKIRIQELLKDGPKRAMDIQRVLGISRAAIRPRLIALVDSGIIELEYEPKWTKRYKLVLNED
jgi:predicted ArsR family transcriptional regulator